MKQKTILIEELIDVIVGLPGNIAEGRTGGFFTTYDSQTRELTSCSYCEFPEERIGRYLRNSTEKITRLVANGDERSLTTADETNGTYGGGIRYGLKFYAFSGFPPLVDEALSVCYAVMDDDSLSDRRLVIVQIETAFGDNPFITQIFDSWCEKFNRR